MRPDRSVPTARPSGVAICGMTLAIMALACGTSHGSTVDGGSSDTSPEVRVIDPPDVACDAGPDAGGACGQVGCFRRCDTCEQSCNAAEGLSCDALVGLCLPERTRQGCGFFTPGIAATWCESGRPCAIRPGDASGECMPPQVCVEARDAGLPEFDCFYADGTPVVTGPPAASCPPSDPRAPFCGGACGRIDCPIARTDSWIGGLPPDCVGLSDTRGYGVCRLSLPSCARDNTLEGCLDYYGDACVCMLLSPSPSADMGRGFTVFASGCRQYRAQFPDSVQCMDENWQVLP